MEQSVRITRVRRIKKNGKGEVINLTVIDLANNKPSIIRKSAQFLQDLKNSFLIDESVNSIDHPQVLKAYKGLKRGLVEGNITYNKAGDKWEVTEDSTVITDKNHPKFGKVKVGDMLEYENDNTRIEGFLDLELSQSAQMLQANATALASATMSMQGAFDDFTSNSTGADTPDLTGDEIPDELMNHIKDDNTGD